MQLTHSFHVPGGVDESWARFQDVAGLAGCFPGAEVTSVDGDEFTGSCKVKLGPIALVYNGTGRFAERDEANRRLVVEAKGKDKRGNGTAAATATLTMAAGASEGTDVSVVTDLAITGKPAQFGRGLMQDVSDRLLEQFVTCLQQQGTAAGPGGERSERSASEATGDGPAESSGVPDGGVEQSAATTGGAASPTASNDALDLGATVLPVLVKNYWKPAAVGAAALAVVIWLVTR